MDWEILNIENIQRTITPGKVLDETFDERDYLKLTPGFNAKSQIEEGLILWQRKFL